MNIDVSIVQQIISATEKMKNRDVMDDLDLLTATEVAEKLKIGKSTVYTLANNGKLPGLRVGGRLRFRPRALHAFMQVKEISAKPEMVHA